MRHTREEVIKRTIQEFERLDHLVNNLTDEDWNRLLTSGSLGTGIAILRDREFEVR